MKQIKFGDMLTTESGIIMHGCNAQGVMGSGIALAIKTKYPAAFSDYKVFCNSTPMDQRLGKTAFSIIKSNIVVANSITQLHFGRDDKKYVSYKAIQECFTAVAEFAALHKLTINYPLIGAGLGGGDWAIISEIIDDVFSQYWFINVSRTLWIYE
jgi:O-acetyl-ADP-ribose deacetylase (regulator of RNase III)